MSKGNTFENDLLLLIFNNTDAALIGDATGLRGSSTAGSLYVALHTADPGEAGTAATGGKVSGGGTTTITFANAVADDVDRIVATVDSSGNRTAITYELT